MTADLSALIARLEAAEVGSREMDDSVVISAFDGEMMDWWDDAARQHQIKAADGSRVNVTPATTSLDAALALAERVHGEARALDLLQDVLSLHDASGIAIRDLPRLLCSFILRAKQGEGE